VTPSECSGGFSWRNVAKSGETKKGAKLDFEQKTPENPSVLEEETEKKWCTEGNENTNRLPLRCFMFMKPRFASPFAASPQGSNGIGIRK